MSAYGKHKATALDFMKFMESDDVQKYLLTQASMAPVVDSPVHRPDAGREGSRTCRSCCKSIQTAVPRPVTPFYPAVTKAIETNVYAALQGRSRASRP